MAVGFTSIFIHYYYTFKSLFADHRGHDRMAVGFTSIFIQFLYIQISLPTIVAMNVIFHVFTAFSGNECCDIYKFDTDERVGVFLARRSVQHLVWSQASYRYPISWEAFLDPSDSYFLFADFVDFYTHLTYICICSFFVAFF
jgi:hypothetical protein